MNRKDVNIPNLDHRDPSAVQLYRLTTKTLWQRFVCLHCCSQLLQIERLQEAVYKAERYWTWVLEKPKKCKHVFSATIRYLLLTKSLATSAPRPGRRSHSAHMGLAFVLLKTNREGKATPDLQGQPCVANQRLHDTMMAQHFKSSTTCPNSQVFCCFATLGYQQFGICRSRNISKRMVTFLEGANVYQINETNPMFLPREKHPTDQWQDSTNLSMSFEKSPAPLLTNI